MRDYAENVALAQLLSKALVALLCDVQAVYQYVIITIQPVRDSVIRTRKKGKRNGHVCQTRSPEQAFFL